MSGSSSNCSMSQQMLGKRHWPNRQIALIFLAVFASPAPAENCRIYPPGPARFACASANHAGLIAKRERDKQRLQKWGFAPDAA
jgi:hypothetical protein